MKELAKIIAARDGITIEEAKQQIKECKEEMFEAIESGNYEEAEDIMEYDLGIEMDYIFDVLYGE